MDRLDLSTARKVDHLCDRFERAWRSGGRPRIDEHLVAAPAEAREALLCELVRLDFWYRTRAGEEPSLEEYRRLLLDTVALSDWPQP
jgi:serine/threonine-protein kinase